MTKYFIVYTSYEEYTNIEHYNYDGDCLARVEELLEMPYTEIQLMCRGHELKYTAPTQQGSLVEVE